MKTIKLVLCCLVVTFFSGCALSSSNSFLDLGTTKVGGVDVLSRNSEVELVVFKTPDDTERFCLSPPPDAVSTFGEGVGFSGTEAVGSEGASIGSSDGALSLGGRGEDILIVRELMYRACEVAMNVNADEDLTVTLYRETLKAVTDILQSSHPAGVNSVAEEGSTINTQTYVRKSVVDSESEDEDQNDDEASDENDEEDKEDD